MTVTAYAPLPVRFEQKIGMPLAQPAAVFSVERPLFTMFSHTRNPLPQRPAPKAVLATVRAESCYPTLRSLINVSLAITFALCALGTVAGVISVTNSFGVFRHGAEATPLFGLYLIGLSAVVAFLAFTGRQAVFVMFDIADLLVAQRADAHAAATWQ